MTPLAEDARGSRLLEFRADESTGGATLTGALVVLRSGGRVLVVFNRWRGEWELPGGTIEPGESARETAARELDEESGQTAGPLAFAGTARLRLAGALAEEACHVFTAATSTTRAFTPNDEIGAIGWWDGSVDLPGGPLNPIDRRLIDLTAGPE